MSDVHGPTFNFNGITETYTYNNRLEITAIQADSSAGTALSLNYTYVSGNNGNIASQTNNVTNDRTQNYTYDSLNRLLTAQTAAASGNDCWGQGFGNNGPPVTMAADALANMFYTTSIHTQCSSPAPQYTMNPSNNNQFAGSGISYDGDGDMTADTTYTYTYDAENRIISASGMPNGPYCYTYDGDGLRVKKAHANGGSCTGTVNVDMLYWRNIAGNTIAETDGTGSTTNPAYTEYVFFAGRRIAQSNPNATPASVHYYFVDHLGSTRTVTDATGTPCFEVDYLPYGIENTPANFSDSCSTNYRFTGYEEDAETSLTNGNQTQGFYYVFARYYNSRLARFMSGDPLDGDLTDPQTLNKYAYVRNNPVNFTDPAGQFLWGGGGDPPPDPAPVGYCDQFPFDPMCTGGGGPITCSDDIHAMVGCYQAGPPAPPPPASDTPIYTDARAVAMRILSGNNDCANFFNSSVFFSAQANATGSVSNNAAAALGSDEINASGHLNLNQAASTPYEGSGFNSAINVNSKPGGAFLGPGDFGPYLYPHVITYTSGGVFASGTLAAQTAAILHELAHTLSVIPEDGGNTPASLANNVTIAGKCAVAIFAAIAGVL
ncbi:MAG: RHS repeat-associated core domain-containing protein [Candidatus Acidiferrales bacterium]